MFRLIDLSIRLRILNTMGMGSGDAVEWLEEAMAEDRAEAIVHALPQMKAMAPAHLPQNRLRAELVNDRTERAS